MENIALAHNVEGQRARDRQRLTFLGWLESTTGVQQLHVISRLKHQRDTDVMSADYLVILA